MLTTLLLTTLARAETPTPATTTTAEGTPTTTATASSAPASDSPAPTSSTPPAVPASAAVTPAPATVTGAASPSAISAAAPAISAAAPTEAITDETKERARRRFRTGNKLANVGIALVPGGTIAAAIGVANFQWGADNPVTDTLLFGGVLGVLASGPTLLAGTYVERSGVRRAGCTPRDQGWSHLPLILGGTGAVATQFGMELGTDAVAPVLLASAYGTAIAQHVRIRKDARACGIWE